MGDSAEEKKRRKNERVKQRYAEDPEFREKRKASSCACHRKNKDAVNARQRHRYATDPEFRAAKRAKRSGMSSDEYATWLADQGGLCVICLKAREKPLRVDHDHKTKKLRSLLCDPCNLGLGHFGDDSAALRRAGDYVDYWQWCHASQSKTGPPPFVLAAANRFLAPTSQTIQYLEPKGDVMTPTDEPTEHNKASRMMRRAILHELLQPFVPDPPPPVDMLQAVARAFVVKASQGDMTAGREILDRIDGKTTAAASAAPETPNEVVFTWQRP
jgi:recombination endonuclease VII